MIVHQGVREQSDSDASIYPFARCLTRCLEPDFGRRFLDDESHICNNSLQLAEILPCRWAQITITSSRLKIDCLNRPPLPFGSPRHLLWSLQMCCYAATCSVLRHARLAKHAGRAIRGLTVHPMRPPGHQQWSIADVTKLPKSPGLPYNLTFAPALVPLRQSGLIAQLHFVTPNLKYLEYPR